MNLQSLCDQAAAYLQQGNPAEAERLYVQVLAAEPANATANHLLGVIRSRQGFHGEALAHYDRALARTPDDPAILFNRGNALYDLKRFDDALASYDRALALRPDIAVLNNNRGNALIALRRHEDALQSYSHALAIRPGDKEALSNSAHTLHQMAQLAWTERRDAKAAIRALERLLRLDPEFAYARGQLLHMKMFGADWWGLEQDQAAIDAGVRAGSRVITPFAYQALSESPADLQACAVIVADHLFPSQPALWTGGDRGHKKIRIGYVSGELREQATAYLGAGLYELHDRDKFEIIAFDGGGSDFSPMRRRLEAAFDSIIPIAQLPDSRAAEAILAEEIDILVNLNGYFGAQRMGVFARRPAPIQVNYLGFPGTLGTPYMDYVLADRIVIPPEERQFYSEKVVWLPGSYQVNDSKRRVADRTPGRAACGLPGPSFVFCNFNAGYKLTPVLFAAWMRILAQVEHSVLWLQESNTAFTENLRQHAERHGIAASRLIFAPRLPAEHHLARMKLADLFLDTLPYNAHTTASDALWMGLPLVTCRGKAFPGRVAASLLHAIGLPELVTGTLDEYERLAVTLARDPALLGSIREKLALGRTTTPLFDTGRFARQIEAAYTMMWERRGKPPQSFSIESFSE